MLGTVFQALLAFPFLFATFVVTSQSNDTTPLLYRADVFSCKNGTYNNQTCSDPGFPCEIESGRYNDCVALNGSSQYPQTPAQAAASNNAIVGASVGIGLSIAILVLIAIRCTRVGRSVSLCSWKKRRSQDTKMLLGQDTSYT